MKTAIVVGHDPLEKGAYSKIIKQSEYDYNLELSKKLKCDFDIYYRDAKLNSYTAKMNKLAKEISKGEYDYVIELHFNKFDGKANKKGHGCEAIIFPNNRNSRDLSNKILKDISEEFEVFNRGVKEHGKRMKGYHFLSKMPCNAIILEPFFGDENEAERFLDLCKYANIIKKHCK